MPSRQPVPQPQPRGAVWNDAAARQAQLRLALSLAIVQGAQGGPQGAALRRAAMVALGVPSAARGRLAALHAKVAAAGVLRARAAAWQQPGEGTPTLAELDALTLACDLERQPHTRKWLVGMRATLEASMYGRPMK